MNDLSAINGICTPSMSLLLILFTVKRFLIKGSFIDDTIEMQFPFILFNLFKMSPEFCWLNLTLGTIIFLDPVKFYLWISWCGKEKLHTEEQMGYFHCLNLFVPSSVCCFYMQAFSSSELVSILASWRLVLWFSVAQMYCLDSRWCSPNIVFSHSGKIFSSKKQTDTA